MPRRPCKFTTCTMHYALLALSCASHEGAVDGGLGLGPLGMKAAEFSSHTCTSSCGIPRSGTIPSLSYNHPCRIDCFLCHPHAQQSPITWRLRYKRQFWASWSSKSTAATPAPLLLAIYSVAQRREGCEGQKGWRAEGCSMQATQMHT